MLLALIQMSLLIACGSFWKSHAPAHIASSSHRRALTDLVFYLLLPALVLDVIWQAPLDSTSLQIPLAAMSGIATGLVVIGLLFRFINVSNAQKGALLLAASFPNATYLGLPVLEQVIGTHSRSFALQYDFFACTPILLTFGILIAHHYGSTKVEVHPLRELRKIPALWAVILGIILNLSDVPQANIIHSVLSLLSGAVVPLMLIVLGMSIRWASLHLRYMPVLLPIAVTSLVLVPIMVMTVSHLIGIEKEISIMLILLGGMPTMVFGIVICERYHLDTELYAAAVTLTTVASLVTLPLWFSFLSV